MAIDVVMPRLGWTMEEGTLVEWLKDPGDTVEAGDLLFTVESDKALNEIESMDAGTLHIPSNAPAAGDVVPVGAVIGYLLAEGEQGPQQVPARAPHRRRRLGADRERHAGKRRSLYRQPRGQTYSYDASG